MDKIKTRWGQTMVLLLLLGGAGLSCGETAQDPSNSSTQQKAQNPLDPSNVPAGDWSDVALLLIDNQKDFWTNDLAAAHPQYEKNIKRLLAFCRGNGIEVIHVRTEFAGPEDLSPSFREIFSQNPPCIRGTDGALPTAFATEEAGERVFVKSRFNCFSCGDLEAYLDSQGKKRLLVAGMTTDLCVFSSVIGAIDHGFSVTLIKDGCVASSRLAHEFVVQRYGGFLFDVVSHDQIAEAHRR